MNGVAAEQQPQRRFIEARDGDDDGRETVTISMSGGTWDRKWFA
jgi:hypothetical protein